MNKIPLKQLPAQKLRVVLDDQNCTLNIYYRFGNVYLDLLVGDADVITGAICRNRQNIITVANNDFKGGLYFLDLLGDSDPEYGLFNDRFVLLFVAAGEEVPGGFSE
jgi:hypothetical protein